MIESPDPSANESHDSNPETTWLAIGDDEDYGWIIGSRAGLEKLKAHIEEAIEKGVSGFGQELDIGYGIVVREEKPRELSRDNESEFFGYVFILTILTILALAAIGLWSILY